MAATATAALPASLPARGSCSVEMGRSSLRLRCSQARPQGSSGRVRDQRSVARRSAAGQMPVRPRPDSSHDHCRMPAAPGAAPALPRPQDCVGAAAEARPLSIRSSLIPVGSSAGQSGMACGGKSTGQSLAASSSHARTQVTTWASGRRPDAPRQRVTPTMIVSVSSARAQDPQDHGACARLAIIVLDRPAVLDRMQAQRCYGSPWRISSAASVSARKAAHPARPCTGPPDTAYFDPRSRTTFSI